MSVIGEIVEGWTEPLLFTLKASGVPVILTGLTLTLKLRRSSGTSVTPGGTVTLLNQVTFPGQLTYTPVEADFVWEEDQRTDAQSYEVHWKAVQAGSPPIVVYFPNGAPDIIKVHRA